MKAAVLKSRTKWPSVLVLEVGRCETELLEDRFCQLSSLCNPCGRMEDGVETLFFVGGLAASLSITKGASGTCRVSVGASYPREDAV